MTEEDAEQLMMNLVTNAITAASRLGTEPQTGKRAVVSVRLVVTESNVLFSVTDNGTGPPAEIAESLFQPFVTGSSEGTGLGLSLVDEISKRAGGQVNWRRENDATIFTFEFSNPFLTVA